MSEEAVSRADLNFEPASHVNAVTSSTNKQTDVNRVCLQGEKKKR